MVCRDKQRNGLTLLEVLVALVITGIVVLVGRGIVEELAVGGRAVIGAVDAQLVAANRDTELRRTFRLAVAPIDSLDRFEGVAERLFITTRCTVPRGWDESCRCTVAVVRDVSPVVLLRRCDVTDAIDTLAEDAVGLRVLYLADARGGGRWLAEWSRSSSLPSAIGIARSAHGDTLLVRIGTRG